MKSVTICILIGGLFLLVLSASLALAHPAVNTAFADKYVKNGSPELQAAFKAKNCNTCHVPGEGRDRRNDYGRAVRNLLTGNVKARLKRDTEKLMAELDAAFEKVGATKPAGSEQTYAEMFKAGKLP